MNRLRHKRLEVGLMLVLALGGKSSHTSACSSDTAVPDKQELGRSSTRKR